MSNDHMIVCIGKVMCYFGMWVMLFNGDVDRKKKP